MSGGHGFMPGDDDPPPRSPAWLVGLVVGLAAVLIALALLLL